MLTTDMSMNRIIIISFFFLSAIAAFADEKITVRNIDTGESFEVSVPDGTKISIQEYNSDWLDSIPYLTEHARRGEQWAYEALAECHRYGKGGMKRSIMNALSYYDLAGKSISDCMDEIEQINHNDPIALFSRLVNYIENEDFERIGCAVDTLNKMGYHSADILLSFLDKSNRIDLNDVLEYATDDKTDPDASLFACIGYALCDKSGATRADPTWTRQMIVKKMPYMYSLLGIQKYESTIKSDDSDGYAEGTTPQDIEDRRKAAEYFLKADEYGALTREAARLLHHYCTGDPSSAWMNLSEENLCRIQQLAGISE